MAYTIKANAGRAEPTARQLKVGEEIRHILAQVFIRNTLHEPLLEKAALTVTEVRMSPDLKQARAYIITLASQDLDEVVSLLNKYSPTIRGEMSKQLTLKFMPRLFFKPDLSYATASRIEDILRSPHVAQDLGDNV